MSVPVRRQTHGKTRRRRAHHALKPMVLAECSKCTKPVQPHHACEFCGFYSKKQVLSTARDAERALKKTERKSAMAKLAEEESAADKSAQTGQKAVKKDKPKA
ncbi:MAG: 50S ribosomal protein L32 [Candidatus Uhrbacteria bacterium]|nr:50S ribosomal protein L32 [Patescibacteria group bacterium]MBU1906881.1 50S ribosomal protein L32 [Patescibacteria group bacterium]